MVTSRSLHESQAGEKPTSLVLGDEGGIDRGHRRSHGEAEDPAQGEVAAHALSVRRTPGAARGL